MTKARIVTVRRLAAADIDPVTKIYAQVVDPSYISCSELDEAIADTSDEISRQAASIFRNQLITLFHEAENGLFVAVANQQVVGFGNVSRRQAEAGHIECWLDDVVVSDKWQRRGVAKALANVMLDWGVKCGAKYFLLESGMTNERAHCLIRKFGFKPLSMVFWRSVNDDQ